MEWTLVAGLLLAVLPTCAVETAAESLSAPGEVGPPCEKPAAKSVLRGDLLGTGGTCGPTPTGVPPAFLEVLPGSEDVEDLRLPQNSHKAEGQRAADEVFDQLDSEEYLSRLSLERERLQREVFNTVLEDYEAELPPREVHPSGLVPEERIYLFISQSIPLRTLRNYAKDIAEIGDPRIIMVLRGFVGGMRQVLPTRRFILDLLKNDPTCDASSRDDCEMYRVNVLIDPLLFRQYDVQVVPSAVYTQDLSAKKRVGSKGLAQNTYASSFWRISGDAGLDYLLGRINDEAKSVFLATLLSGCRK